ncbi:unnamed protein product [Closterium sp. NIES-53]
MSSLKAADVSAAIVVEGADVGAFCCTVANADCPAAGEAPPINPNVCSRRDKGVWHFCQLIVAYVPCRLQRQKRGANLPTGALGALGVRS